ncbi:hypothetical protein GBA52_009846 [Prunus armeniaca]|nr:hypothetical protein GBA52_009846 [Prunus armeniaca]
MFHEEDQKEREEITEVLGKESLQRSLVGLGDYKDMLTEGMLSLNTMTEDGNIEEERDMM